MLLLAWLGREPCLASRPGCILMAFPGFKSPGLSDGRFLLQLRLWGWSLLHPSWREGAIVKACQSASIVPQLSQSLKKETE